MKPINLFRTAGMLFSVALEKESPRHNAAYTVFLTVGEHAPVRLSPGNGTATLLQMAEEAIKAGDVPASRLPALRRVLANIRHRNYGYSTNPLACVEYLCRGFRVGGDLLTAARQFWQFDIMRDGMYRAA